MIKNFSLPVASFLVGIFFQPFLPKTMLLSFILGSIILGIFWFRKHIKSQKIKLTAILFMFGIGYPFLFSTNIFPTELLQTEQKYIGTIINAPEQKKNFQQVYLKITQPTTAKALLKTDKNFSLFYGQKISFTGRAYLPPKFGSFDYKKYLARHEITAIVSAKSDIKILDTNRANSFIFYAQKTRAVIQKSLNKILPSDKATIATGMLLGVKKNLSETTDANFRAAGLTHLLVVSGANVSLIIILVSLALRPLGRPFIFVGSMLTILFFIGMTGADPPIIRASLMGGLIALAPLSGRVPDYKIILLLSAAIIALINPRVVQQDIGFFLSFAATAGIILGSPIFLAGWKKIFGKKLSTLANILSVTMCAQFFVLPISAFFFESFPLGGFIANILAEPVVPFITIGSMFVGIFSILPLAVAKILSLPVFILIEILETIAGIFSQLPALEISQSTALIFVIFETIILLILFFSKKIEEKFYVTENDIFSIEKLV